EGMTVVDLCSAPGGKTTHIAEILFLFEQVLFLFHLTDSLQF
ncbi:Ribosomal RNA small subunit methyltransferase B, partial [human gut metagenome]